jgi:hypothetical protein
MTKNEQILRDALQTVLDEGLPFGPGYAKVESDARAALAATASESAPAQAEAPAAWISEKNLAAIKGKGMAYATGFDIGGQIPLYTHPAPSQSAVLDVLRAENKRLEAQVDSMGRAIVDLGKSQSADQVREVVTFGLRGDKMYFAVGVQSFTLDYEPEDDAQLRYMSDMLTRAIARAQASPAPAAQESAEASAGALDVLAERKRQIDVEGWTPKHDDQYVGEELALAAVCYANTTAPGGPSPNAWPWPEDWWKPSDNRRNLVKAGALVIAEIERIDRLATSSAKADLQ